MLRDRWSTHRELPGELTDRARPLGEQNTRAPVRDGPPSSLRREFVPFLHFDLGTQKSRSVSISNYDAQLPHQTADQRVDANEMERRSVITRHGT